MIQEKIENARRFEISSEIIKHDIKTYMIECNIKYSPRLGELINLSGKPSIVVYLNKPKKLGLFQRSVKIYIRTLEVDPRFFYVDLPEKENESDIEIKPSFKEKILPMIYTESSVI